MKVVRSNYTKNEKLKCLTSKLKKFLLRYTTLKLNYEMVKENLEFKDTQLINFEDLLKQYETEIEKINNEKNCDSIDKQRDESNHYIVFNTFGSNHSDTVIINKNEDNNLISLNEKIVYYEEKIKQTNKDKEEMKNQIVNLREVVNKNEEFMSGVNKELNMTRVTVLELNRKIDQLKNDKLQLKYENDILNKEKSTKNLKLKLDEEYKSKVEMRNASEKEYLKMKSYNNNFNSTGNINSYENANYESCPLSDLQDIEIDNNLYVRNILE